VSWLATKLFLKKAVIWAKNHWKILALAAYTLVLYLVFSKKARNAKKILEITKQSHKAEVDAINKSHAEVLKKRDESLKKYQEIMRQLEQEHAERREVISSDKKKRVKQIVEDSGDDPQKLAEMLKDTFGFEIDND
jgi:vacuolar-type H+-ATPase subunit H